MEPPVSQRGKLAINCPPVGIVRRQGDNVDKLKCPICNKEALMRKVEGRGWIIYCTDFLCVEQRYGSATKQDAIDNWKRKN